MKLNRRIGMVCTVFVWRVSASQTKFSAVFFISSLMLAFKFSNITNGVASQEQQTKWLHSEIRTRNRRASIFKWFVPPKTHDSCNIRDLNATFCCGFMFLVFVMLYQPLCKVNFITLPNTFKGRFFATCFWNLQMHASYLQKRVFK